MGFGFADIAKARKTDPQAAKRSGWRAPQAEQPAETPGWNASGYWPDPLSERFGGENGYRPHEFVAALAGTPEARDYTRPEGAAGALGVEGVQAGGAATKRDMQRGAQAQGLGRGFAEQAGATIDQQTRQSASETMLGASLEGEARRYELALSMTEALVGANEARFTDYLAGKQAKAAKKAKSKGFLGSLISGVGSVLGGLIPGGED